MLFNLHPQDRLFDRRVPKNRAAPSLLRASATRPPPDDRLHRGAGQARKLAAPALRYRLRPDTRRVGVRGRDVRLVSHFLSRHGGITEPRSPCSYASWPSPLSTRSNTRFTRNGLSRRIRCCSSLRNVFVVAESVRGYRLINDAADFASGCGLVSRSTFFDPSLSTGTGCFTTGKPGILYPDKINTAGLPVESDLEVGTSVAAAAWLGNRRGGSSATGPRTRSTPAGHWAGHASSGASRTGER